MISSGIRIKSFKLKFLLVQSRAKQTFLFASGALAYLKVSDNIYNLVENVLMREN